jgi:hypothetical protein
VPETDALLEQQERTRSGIELLVEEWCREGIAPFSRPQAPHVIVTSGSDGTTPSGFDHFIRTRAPDDVRRLGPTRIKRVLTKDWGTSHFRGRVGGQPVSGIELPPLPVLRNKFEDRCNGGRPISWLGSLEWVASYGDGVSNHQVPQPAAQSTEDVGTPGGEITALDDMLKPA